MNDSSSTAMTTPKGYTFCYYVSGHGFGHATRVNQIITELLKSTRIDPTTQQTSSVHTIYIVSDAPQFIFQDVIALGAVYRNAKVDAGVVQPLAYSVDREKTIEGVKTFLARREEMIQLEMTWLAEVEADCVLADAPFLPCAAASAYGIPACLITNFTFDEVYRFLREGDPLDKDVIACADAALSDYKKASLLLRLPGSIDIPSFEDEIVLMKSSSLSNGSPSISDMDDLEEDVHHLQQCEGGAPSTKGTNGLWQTQQSPVHGKEAQLQPDQYSLETSMGETTPSGVMSPASMQTAVSSPEPAAAVSRFPLTALSPSSSSSSTALSLKLQSLTRKVIDVPLVVRMAVNTREDVLRSLGVDEETIRTKKMVLVSFGGQRLKQGWGNPLPEGWIGVICGLPVEHELPEGFYRSPHGVYVPDLTRAADIVIGKLGYGTCSECIAHDTPLIYVPRPQFVEEHGLIKMMINHGLSVEMTAEEFETGQWQRSILEADRQAQEEREGRRLHDESCEEDEDAGSHSSSNGIDRAGSLSTDEASLPSKSLAESVNMGELATAMPVSRSSRRRSRRSSSVTSLSAFRPKGVKMARLSPAAEDEDEEEGRLGTLNLEEEEKMREPAVWFERRIPNNGGEVCARLVQEFMAQLEEEL
ncbi:hypothetical protein BGZ75_001364 [Mortierella antarctica]|nr:hypothetical protein BGZ75_001364 [Mortierella antarctica]